MELELALCTPPVVLMVVSTLSPLSCALSTPVELGVPGLRWSLEVDLARGGTLL